ncbi:hypothetical protein B0H65DRAFT_474504 [Neurospora tetraspora]|uniref:GYF domain-containing protein n=1 Tax=Neurospora tetraspora TaxID=94610 RepID=A0AAE0MNX0_9PEZI|nr:hypothetical protein B0H65DRAFT_474504 [Neurospora tetraspora]
MPTQLPSSFASAAAGQTTRGDARSGARGDSVRGAGSGEWARSNGTRTFRRSSTTPFNNQSAAASNSTDATQNPALDSNSINNTSSASQPAPPAPDQQQQNNQQQHNPGPLRYSKDELYEIYKHSAEAANNIDMSSLFAPSWNPNQTNGTASRLWGKTGDSPHVPQDPTVCWDPNGTVKPIGLEPMTAEERDMFATDVNSTLKPPQQQNKEGVQGIQNGGRKTSISVNTSNFPTASPASASRPATRRRETADTNPFPSSAVASPTTAGRFPRDDPWLPRRNTDLRESITDEPAEENPPTRTQPFGLTRSNTAGSSAFGSSASLWGPAATTPGAGIGAFGSFALNTTSTIGEKRFGGTGGSRLAHLIPKDSNENVAANKGNESAPGTDTNRGWRPRQRTDTDPFGPDDSLTGSAILGGAQDNSPPASSLQRSGVFDTPAKGSSGDFGMSALNLGNNQSEQGNGPASPSETNPYRSPLAERGDEGHDDAEIDRLTSEPQSNFSTLSRAFGGAPFDGSDRSQTSSVGAKGFPTVNTLGGWPTAPSVGTPDRERQPFNSAFGTSIFSPIGDLQSPGFGGLGGFGVGGGSGLGRANKLSSLFPPAMQAQMHGGHEQENLSDSVPDLRQANPLGAIGRGAIGTQPRDAASPMRAGRGAFEDLFPGTDAMKSPFTSGEHQPGLTSTAPSSGFPATTAGAAFSATPTAGEPNQQQQQRTMVMPDRMRWVYLDPQGQMQGPFSGLEMNDWYKANFFSPDLRVKRVEDPDFEPLGQLIRRIGNSREPFLVPQMGIPHGPPPSAGPFALGGAAEAIPPLQGAFPSFGRTLTAAQQNDLERRKQEEQLYHARQREFLHHHQSFGRLPLQPGIPGALHHHSSAHSLQSQPSFGSITSPIGMPQPPIGAIGPNSGFFEAPVSLGQAPAQPGLGPDLFAPDLNLGERQLLANLQANGGLPGSFPAQPIGAPIGDNSSLRSNLPSVDQLRNDEQGFNAKLKEFHELRAQHDAEEAAAQASAAAAQEVLQEVKEEAPKPKEEPKAAPAPAQETVKPSKKQTQETKEVLAAKEVAPQPEVSLTEKIKKTQAENNAAKLAQQAAASGLPMPFPPPPQANTPLAAPTAQRPASGLPARYGERSGSGTPDTTSDASVLAPPPTAPWAGTEAQKGPSLKEIQEAEAKKAAKKEEAAAAARRAALEQEAAALREREKAAAAAHIGLPATSTWGTGSPVAAPASGSPWKQPAAKVATTTTTGSKKTLAEIQREEELRKQKAKEAAIQASVISGSALGKRYADLASKTSSSSAPPGMITPGAAAQAAAAAAASVGGGWSTVGAGGKVKIPTGPAATSRPVSTAPANTPVAPAAKVVAKAAPAALKDAKNVAMEEFKKWLHRELSRGLNGVNDIETFASTLLELPLDVSILSECVYGFSTTMDGRHFAEEFVRRRKLADKGIVEKDSNTGAMSSSNGGWSEVAKKGGNSTQSQVKEDPMAAVPGFRVVQAKKGKGKK